MTLLTLAIVAVLSSLLGVCAERQFGPHYGRRRIREADTESRRQRISVLIDDSLAEDDPPTLQSVRELV